MEQSTNVNQSADVRSILLNSLKQNQAQWKEGSIEWRKYQERIDQIVADNFLEYVNR
jgi:hypothetical protein